jgi:hypothetical protein
VGAAACAAAPLIILPRFALHPKDANVEMSACAWIGLLATQIFALPAAWADPALERKSTPWPKTRLARPDAFALIETLNACILCTS